MKNIYDPKFIEELFDKMSYSYDGMNRITSFGFSERWRKQFIEEIEIKKGDTVADLLTGMGECWAPILNKIGTEGKLIALDFSDGMLNHAKNRKQKFQNYTIQILKENVFNNSIPSNSIDVIVSGFGIKTFSTEQLKDLAKEFKRIMKVEGTLTLVDVSVPSYFLLKYFYMLYLKRVIPVLGKLFLGNPETYKMLGIYTEQFNNSKSVAEIFKSEGFEINYISYFYGCASGINGKLICNESSIKTTL